ncbi:hypothetical protein N2152v2_002209 [Parachlorella kessleri]
MARSQKRKAAAEPQEEAPQPAAKQQKGVDGLPSSNGFKNKEKVLVLSSRGITFRFRHLMLDLVQLVPHAKKDAKLDTKSERQLINEGCTSVMFFEARKHKDLYLWLAKAPNGPCAKFHITNIHTLAELKLSGNHLKGSRPVLSFDATFDQQPHLQLLKEMLTQVFATPKKHHKSKPFFDHVISFSVADGRIWLRNYQVLPNPDKKRPKVDDVTLVEVGPRCCLNPIKMFSGSFGGPVVYENPTYVSPNTIRALLKKQQSGKYAGKVASKAARKQHVADNPLPHDELADVFR